MKKTAAILTALALSACTPQAQYTYVSDARTQAEFPADRFACLKESAEAAPPVMGTTNLFGDDYSYDAASETRGGLMEACMAARGWRLQKAGL